MLTSRSLQRLVGVHPDIAATVRRAEELANSQGFDLFVVEGVRLRARQEALYHMGRSRTLYSRHLTGHALDVAPLAPNGAADWHPSAFSKVVLVMRAAAGELGVEVEWGGDFPMRYHTDFVDMPHWQLPRSLYADTDLTSENVKVREYLATGRIL
jgi:peptidoglycan L-alanyl-D-glutamate endopeptidase CwlK